MKKLKSKKSQLTVFIILGILILFTTSLVFYLLYGIGGFQYVPRDVRPVKDYVEVCIEKTATDAIILAGSQGGYVDVPFSIKNNPMSFLPMIPGSNAFIVPYWYYNDETRIPSLANIESQITFYILENLNSCLNDFEPFQSQFDIKELEFFSPEVRIGERSVIVNMEYPLEINDLVEQRQYKISKFRNEIGVRLGRIHEFAEQVMLEENKQMWLEKLTIDTMVLAPEIPFSGMQASPCRPMTWYVSDVKEALIDYLYYNLPRIKLQDTDHQPFGTGEEYERTQMTWDVTGKRYKDIKANFVFERNWRTMLRVRPSRGNLMRSGVQSGVAQFLSVFCINIYNFNYDVEYPVMVSLRDEAAFNGAGFNFRFAFPVLVEHNEGKRVYTPPAQIPEPNYVESFCDSRTETSVDIRVVDFYSLNELADVNITYQCLVFQCPLGSTKPDNVADRLLSTVPQCVNGEVIAEKEGYLPAREILLQGHNEITLDMIPLRKFEIRMLKYNKNNLLSSSYIDRDNMIFIQLTDLANKRVVSNVYPGITDDPVEVELVDGDNTYMLELTLLKSGEIVGGYKAEWPVRYSELKNKEQLTLKVIEFPITGTDEELMDMFDYLDNSTLYADKLRPEFG